MRVSPDVAAAVFHRLPGALQAPSLHPAYVQADTSRASDLAPVFFVYEHGGEFLYHAFHMAAVPGSPYQDIQSPYGYGGPVATSEDPEFLAQAWQNYSDWCCEQRVIAEFVRFHPLLRNWRFFSGDVLHDRETVYVDLKLPDLLSSYGIRARTAVRKATKQGLHLEWWPAEEFNEIFQPLYYATMGSLKASSFYFFPATYFEQLDRWDSVHRAVCLYGNQPVAAAIFLQGSEILEYHLSAANDVGKKLGATNLLLHEAGLFGQKAGLGQLHLGGGTTAESGNSLLFFKSGFSAARASFKIGRRIHDPAVYLELKSQWQKKTGSSGNRVLFYREN